MALPWSHTLLPGPKWGVGRGGEGEGDEAGIVSALVGLERAPLTTIREAQRWLPTGSAPTSAFDLEARSLTSTRTHGQVCPLVQSTKDSMFFAPGCWRRVWYNKKMDFGVRDLGLSLCNWLAVWLWTSAFSRGVWDSHLPREKEYAPRLLGKINPIR